MNKFEAGWVWSGSYNWLQSNRLSARDMIARIDQVILPYYAKRGVRAKKMVLVTHSMGGLVSRAISRLENYGNLLGISHGVMPATGAAARPITIAARAIPASPASSWAAMRGK